MTIINGDDPAQATNGTRRIKFDMDAIAEELLRQEKEEQKPQFDRTRDYALRYSRHTGQYWMFSNGIWVEANSEKVRRHLQIEEGCSNHPPEKGAPTEVDEAMHAAIKYWAADKVGGYAGYLHQGVTKLPNGDTLLVPTARKLLTPTTGTSDFTQGFVRELLPRELQADALFSWAKTATTSLYLGEPGKMDA
jgi:hypothetical protein